MQRIRYLKDFQSSDFKTIDKESWTVLIPAAGRGSRLGYELPKVIFPILGKSLLEWLLDKVSPYCENIVLVLSPEGRPFVEPVALRHIPSSKLKIAIQNEPKGMADAIFQAAPLVTTPNVLIVWGDQVTLTRKTIHGCLSTHMSSSQCVLTLPTIFKEDPYIHFERDENEKIVRVLQKREGEIPVGLRGENDCGLFLFRTHTLFDELEKANDRNKEFGNITGEFNLLPLIPLFDQTPGSVLSLRIDNEEETLGVNTLDDAKQAALILSRT